jgi:hypothetical protein
MNDAGINWAVLGAGLAMAGVLVATQKCLLEPLGHWLKAKYPKY